MEGKKILVAGVSGFVGYRLALELCQSNEVHGLARFRDEKVKQHLESKGVICVAKDVSKDSLDDLPVDFDYVFNELIMVEDGMAAAGLQSDGERQRKALALNAHFVGRLISHCRSARGVIQTSTAGLYPWSPAASRWRESDSVGPQGDYALSKFVGEAVATFASVEWGIPTCILRLAYPYSEEGGLIFLLAHWIANRQPIKVNRRQARCYNPIYLSDNTRARIIMMWSTKSTKPHRSSPLEKEKERNNQTFATPRGLPPVAAG